MLNSSGELQASRSRLERLWMLEAEKPGGGDPPAEAVQVINGSTRQMRGIFVVRRHSKKRIILLRGARIKLFAMARDAPRGENFSRRAVSVWSLLK